MHTLTSLLCCLALTGCVTTSSTGTTSASQRSTAGGNSAVPSPSSNYGSLSRSGYTAQQAEENALRLQIGLSGPEVENLLGKPTTTESTTCGAALGKPWKAILWNYKWVYPSRILTLYFAINPDNTLLLSSWNWY